MSRLSGIVLLLLAAAAVGNGSSLETISLVEDKGAREADLYEWSESFPEGSGSTSWTPSAAASSGHITFYVL